MRKKPMPPWGKNAENWCAGVIPLQPKSAKGSPAGEESAAGLRPMRYGVPRFSGVRRLAMAVAVVAVAALAASPALAEPAVCRQLQADYLSADRSASRAGGGGDAGQLRRDLAAAQAQARRLGCQRFLFFGPKPSKQCPSIMARVNRLQRDLNRSSGFGWGNFGAGQASFERDRLRSALIRNGCEIPVRSDWAGSGYRTLCVRTCDGFYFPISFSTSRARFKIDEAVCKAMYGGADAELYVHYNGSPSEQAASLSGKRYLNLPTALLYRSEFNRSCQAQLHAGLKGLAAAQEVALARAEAAQAAERAADPEGARLPVPTARVPEGEDPETLANLAGDFRVEPVMPETEDVGAVADAGGAAEIRRLGPDYYYRAPVTLDGLKREPWKAPDFSFVGTANAGEPQDTSEAPPETSVQ